MSEQLDALQGQSAQSGAAESIGSLAVKFDAGGFSRNKVLYANGRMQVKVQVVVSGMDRDGDVVAVSDEVMESIRLIHYDSGKTLRNGWQASAEQGRFTLAVAHTSTDAEDDGDEDSLGQRRVRTFWVSSENVETIQIGASLKFDNTIIRSNGTTLSSRHDSSVSVEAILPVTYAVEQFRWQDVWYDGGFRNQRIYKYYLGLYPNLQQVKLVDWIAEDSVKNVVFAFGNKINAWNAAFQAGIMVRPDRQSLDVSLPFTDTSGSTPDSIKDIYHEKDYEVRVNDRVGELTVVQLLSPAARDQPPVDRSEVFRFTALDQFGTEHKLAIRTDFKERSFRLERG
ncbi:hypothetical protein JRG42_05520 [Pseudomonas granadensis]|uniref:Uncharacterized protein n=1 Tax=Pseudomonas granadensis TaxID=1421430 RepID=A0ABX7GIC4_9PSED|nr:hypothetical protein [Pseudomonas granadensis]MBN6772889.1 hypothetical protein [Pseudomonas granadensis]MBN6803925.1 hypothetical protein [Pseudomonas granadensis]MBN6830604.1 hypothetical protein [Pseudomonas granadensis]MBN6838146.1 hypothetical protein [Pseudomonas granadensis]MBN6867508.1 hypothetical protein [Pseudomonas granadensis]